MPHRALLELLCGLPEVRLLLDGMAAPRDQLVHGLASQLKPAVAAALAAGSGRSLLLVTPNLETGQRAATELATWLGPDSVSLFPPLEVLPYEVVVESNDTAFQRIEALSRLYRPGHTLVVPATALLRRLVPPEVFRRYTIALHQGQEHGPRDLALRLTEAGYGRTDLVETPGQFSLRGGILDVFSPGEQLPVRIEFYGDQVDTIRAFDPSSQRSVEELPATRILPARELILDAVRAAEGIARLEREAQALVRKLGATPAATRLSQRLEEVGERLRNDPAWDGSATYAPYFYPELVNLLAYLPRQSLVVLDEAARLREALEDWEKDIQGIYASRLEQGQILPGQLEVYTTWDGLAADLKQYPVIHLAMLLKQTPGSEPGRVVSLPSRPVQLFQGQWPRFIDEVRRWKREGRTMVIVTSSDERQRRLAAGLSDYDLHARCVGDLAEPPLSGTITIARGMVERGFEVPALGLVLISDGDIFGRTKSRRVYRRRAAEVRPADWLDLKPGDYVVHVSHGVGKYLGVRTLEIEGAQRDYLFVKYAGADALYVPTDQINLLQKYVGAEGHEPRLNRLGGTEWARVKNRVRDSVRQLAQDLLLLYASRERVRGHAFRGDTTWQAEFEDAFKYEETPDQLQAAEEIKRDMEKSRPMDRLLCGDVGYGKTEVAIRAAFKAVTDGKQVAVLVPTTILAQQHYHTFRERFEGYPVHIEVLSRFRSPREQAEIVERLRAGRIDILIGTHRLLSDDVVFSDLGLLIIDEEHRFGVAHKEKIKQLKTAVDVLTLTATPIPRTLHMALTSLRDMSVINTPPEDRFPVQTYVVPYDESLVADAIARELHRGGQVFYVHNRIQTIDRAARRVAELAPQARVVVGHGQMKEDHLEKVILDFLDGEFDVLVSTTIIESGLDMPNVNTLIVEEADKLGLAQLYQLRGRVGRSDRLAYAYFMYRKERLMNEVAEKRLAAIAEFTELGSGFKLAMRDLEIRGAGNILGPEQHGYMVSVGFEMYCRLLEQAVRELKGVPEAEERPQVTVEVGISAYLPDSYIPDTRQKVEFYKRIAQVSSVEMAHDIAEELIDRYGELPDAAENLLAVARIKVYAHKLGIAAIGYAHGRVTFKPSERATVNLVWAKEAMKQYQRRLFGASSRNPVLMLRVEDIPRERLLRTVETFLRRANEAYEERRRGYETAEYRK